MKEIWKDVKGHEGLYSVSNLGNIKGIRRKVYAGSGKYRINKERVLKIQINSRGYSIVMLSVNGIVKTRTVHQLVAESFIGHRACGHLLVVHHIDSNRQNNHIDNLEVITQRENISKRKIDSTSEFTGVSWNKERNKWASIININGSKIYLGFFHDEYKAHLAYQKSLKEVKNNFFHELNK